MDQLDQVFLITLIHARCTRAIVSLPFTPDLNQTLKIINHRTVHHFPDFVFDDYIFFRRFPEIEVLA